MTPLRPIVAAATICLVLSGCAPTASQTPTPTPTATSAAPSASGTPATGASVPFGGDCSLALPDAEVVALLDSDEVEPVTRTLITVEPDLGASLGLIGGVSCNWRTDAAFLGIAVFPASVVPSEVADSVGATSCDESATLCSGSTIVGTAWVYAQAATESGASDALQRVSERAGEQPDPRAAIPSSDWWSIPSCTDLAPAVASASGVTGLQAGFPSDSVPSGVSWDTAVANGVTAWCPWYSYAGDQPYIIELDLQPGIGVPGDALLEEASATPLDVEGADQAFLIPHATGEGIARVVAVSGPNRLTVTGGSGGTVESLSAVAAGVLAELDGG